MSKIVFVSMIASAFLIGCGIKKQNIVVSSFVMTAANKNATVTKQDSWKKLLMPEALALVPTGILDSTGLNIALNTAWVVVGDIELEATETTAAGEIDGVGIYFKGPFFVDLLTISPVILDTEVIPNTKYKRLKLKLVTSATAPPGVPSDVYNHSLYITGIVGTNNFTYQSVDTTEINIGGPNSVTTTNKGHTLVEINFANIFRQINMSTIANNEMINSANRHPGINLCNSIDPIAADIYTCIRKGMEKHANAGDDTNHDDELDSTEASVK